MEAGREQRVQGAVRGAQNEPKLGAKRTDDRRERLACRCGGKGWGVWSVLAACGDHLGPVNDAPTNETHKSTTTDATQSFAHTGVEPKGADGHGQRQLEVVGRGGEGQGGGL